MYPPENDILRAFIIAKNMPVIVSINNNLYFSKFVETKIKSEE